MHRVVFGQSLVENTTFAVFMLNTLERCLCLTRAPSVRSQTPPPRSTHGVDTMCGLFSGRMAPIEYQCMKRLEPSIPQVYVLDNTSSVLQATTKSLAERVNKHIPALEQSGKSKAKKMNTRLPRSLLTPTVQTYGISPNPRRQSKQM